MHIKHLRDYFRDDNGNFAIILAFTLPVILIGVGIAIDYGHVVTERARLQANLDAAVLAGQKAVLNGTDGISVANSYFSANLPWQGPTASFVYDTDGISIKGSATWSMPTLFGGFTGVPTLPVNVYAEAANENNSNTTTTTTTTQQPKKYINIYFLVDTSDSMGIGATSVDQANMLKATASVVDACGTIHNDVQCAFACHNPWATSGQWNGGNSKASCTYNGTTNGDPTFWPNGNWDFLEANGHVSSIPASGNNFNYRIDYARSAVQNAVNTLIQKSNGTNGVINVSIWSLDSHAVQIQALTSPSSISASVYNNIQLKSGVGTGDTNIHQGMVNFAQALSQSGDGSSPQSPLGFVIFMTDGIQDASYSPANGDTGNDPNFVTISPNAGYSEHYMEPINSIDCSAIKQKLYSIYLINYQISISNTIGQDNDDRVAWINDNMYSIQSGMMNCASSSNYIPSDPSGSTISDDLSSVISSIIAPLSPGSTGTNTNTTVVPGTSVKLTR